jgi:putative DNA primase/helicase
MHILAGEAGTGKTCIAMSLAAILSRGGQWPDGAGAKPGNVLIWSGEDSLKKTILPRLVAAGADLTRMKYVGAAWKKGERRSFDPATDTDLLRAELGGMQVDLIVVDPIVAAVSEDSHKNAEVRKGLQPLIDLGQELDAAILGITHFSKGTQGKNHTDRVTGSLAFAAVARIVVVAAKRADAQEGESSRIFCKTKANITTDEGGFGYDMKQVAVDNDIEVTSVAWGEPIAGTAKEILAEAEGAKTERGHAVDDAKDFLFGLLSDGAMSANDIKADGEQAGHSWRSLERAKKELEILSVKTANEWKWTLPKTDKNEGSLPRLHVSNIGGLPSLDALQTRANTGFCQDRQSSVSGSLGNIGGLENQDLVEVEI